MIDTFLTIHILTNFQQHLLVSLIKGDSREAPFKQIPIIISLNPLQLRDLPYGQLSTGHLNKIHDPRLVIVHLIKVVLQISQ